MTHIDPDRQVCAVVAIHRAIEALAAAQHAELQVEAVRAETELFALIDQLLEQIARDVAAAECLGDEIAHLQQGKASLEWCADRTRELIESAFVAADIPRLERPMARLELCRPAAELVIEEPTAVPSRYRTAASWVFDPAELIPEIKRRQAMLEAVLAAPATAREPVLAAFEQRFLTRRRAGALRARLVGFDCADSPAARAVARAALRRDFAAMPGVRLTQPPPRLMIAWREPPRRCAAPDRRPATQEPTP